MEQTNFDIGAAVKRAITQHGTSENKVAQAIGLPRTTFYRRATGHASFTGSDLIKIAQHLGIDARDLLPSPSTDPAQ
jgi:transcriptional regulator with XRE-family HTH domain